MNKAGPGSEARAPRRRPVPHGPSTGAGPTRDSSPPAVCPNVASLLCGPGMGSARALLCTVPGGYLGHSSHMHTVTKGRLGAGPHPARAWLTAEGRTEISLEESSLLSRDHRCHGVRRFRVPAGAHPPLFLHTLSPGLRRRLLLWLTRPGGRPEEERLAGMAWGLSKEAGPGLQPGHSISTLGWETEGVPPGMGVPGRHGQHVQSTAG